MKNVIQPYSFLILVFGFNNPSLHLPNGTNYNNKEPF